jgi:hypothetical protein
MAIEEHSKTSPMTFDTSLVTSNTSPMTSNTSPMTSDTSSRYFFLDFHCIFAVGALHDRNSTPRTSSSFSCSRPGGRPHERRRC